MARDFIDYLFETKDGLFVQLIKYFNKKLPGGILSEHPDILGTHLAVLIKSKTNQQLSELRENLGEIYFRIKKSLSTDLSRKRDIYNKFVVKGIQYIKLNHNSTVNLELPQVDKTYLISKLLKKEFKNYNVSQILAGVLEILYSQQEFCKAIKEKHLLIILREYYTLNMKAEIENNVEYIEYEEENESFYPFEGIEEYERN